MKILNFDSTWVHFIDIKHSKWLVYPKKRSTILTKRPIADTEVSLDDCWSKNMRSMRKNMTRKAAADLDGEGIKTYNLTDMTNLQSPRKRRSIRNKRKWIKKGDEQIYRLIKRKREIVTFERERKRERVKNYWDEKAATCFTRLASLLGSWLNDWCQLIAARSRARCQLSARKTTAKPRWRRTWRYRKQNRGLSLS